MKKIFVWLSLFVVPFLAGGEYYARLEPFETYTVKSAVAGEVLFADAAQEGKIAGNAPVIKIDSVSDEASLEAAHVSFEALQESLAITEKMAANQEAAIRLDADYYGNIKNLKTKSRREKEKVFTALAASRNQLLSLQNQAATLNRQIAETKAQIIALEQTIEKKRVAIAGLYLYRMDVRRGDYVNPGSNLLTAMDLSSGKLVIYLNREDRETAGQKKISLDGNPSNAKISKIWEVTDSVQISAYRAEIVLEGEDLPFSKLFKVELK